MNARGMVHLTVSFCGNGRDAGVEVVLLAMQLMSRIRRYVEGLQDFFSQMLQVSKEQMLTCLLYQKDACQQCWSAGWSVSRTLNFGSVECSICVSMLFGFPPFHYWLFISVFQSVNKYK